jgi:hypothetical protein
MKIVLYIALIFLALWGGTIWYNVVISGNYYITAPFYHTVFLVLVLVVGIYICFRLVKWIKNTDLKNLWVFVPLVIVIATIQSCSYAKSNQIVLYSEDCGVNWKQVSAGSRVPNGGTNPCFVKETMPAFEMQGDMDFFVLFKDQVKVKIRLTYSYLVEDPLLFMKSAKKLGKSNADADDAQDDNERFEGAENRVIETRIKKVTSDEFPKEDVVSHDINTLELTYVDLVNAELKSRGVRITTFEMVPDFQPLTQQAIDAANADRIYTAKGMQEFGRQITLAKAGANQINIQTKKDE